MWILAIALIASADGPPAVERGVDSSEVRTVLASTVAPLGSRSDRMRRARRHHRAFRTLRTRLPRRSRLALSPDSRRHERITAVDLSRAATIGRRVAYVAQLARTTHRRGRDQGRPPAA